MGRAFLISTLLFGLALLGFGLWLWVQGRSEPRGDGSRHSSASATLEPVGEPLEESELQAPGVPAARQSGVKPEGDGAAVAITGNVRWPDGTPARATVTLVRGGGDGEPLSETTSRARDGRFWLDPAPDEPWELFAQAPRKLEVEPGEVHFISWRARHGPRSGAARDLELVLDPGLQQRGWIRDTSNQPLRGSVFAMPASDRDEPEQESAGTSEDGAFLLLGLQRGLWTLRAESDGYLAEERTLELPVSEPLVFQLQRGAALAGRVLDDTGEPVAGAEVVAHHFEGPVAATRTAVDGSFALHELLSGTLRVVARRAGEMSETRLDVELEPGEEYTGIALVLPRSGALEVWVLDDRGRAVAGARVRASGPTGTPRYALSGEDGSAYFEGLEPGDYVLVADLSSRMRLAGSVAVQAVETSHVELIQPAVVRRIQGRVRVDGVPRGDLELEARRLDSRATVGSATTHLDGSFVLDLAESGEHWISVRDPARGFVESRRVLVPDAEFVPLDLELHTGRLQGVVWGAEGEALAGVEVQAYSSSEDGLQRSSASGRSAANGEFALELPAGVHVLEAREGPSTEGGGSSAPTRVPGVVVRAGEVVTGIELTLERGARLEGHVRRRDGTGVYGAHLWLATPGSKERPRRLGTSGTLGRFRLEGLPLGTWLVTASDGERQAAWREVTIGAGTIATLELVLE